MVVQSSEVQNSTVFNSTVQYIPVQYSTQFKKQFSFKFYASIDTIQKVVAEGLFEKKRPAQILPKFSTVAYCCFVVESYRYRKSGHLVEVSDISLTLSLSDTIPSESLSDDTIY